MITPISPNEAIAQKNDLLELIVKNFLETLTRQDVFNKSFLDIEAHYRKSGWNVSYDRPNYCENYRHYYIFKEL